MGLLKAGGGLRVEGKGLEILTEAMALVWRFLPWCREISLPWFGWDQCLNG